MSKLSRMVPLQLFVPLAVLLLSDAAPSRTQLTCAYENEDFCWHMKQACEQAYLVKGNLTDAKFADDRERMSNLIKVVDTVLKTKEKSALLELLRRGLDLSMNALFQLKVTCNQKRSDPQCKETLIALFIVTQDLGKAIISIYTGRSLGVMQQADKVFYEQLHGGQSGVDLAYPFGEIILKALELDQK